MLFHRHQYVPGRTETIQQDGRRIELTTDIFCVRCGRAILLIPVPLPEFGAAPVPPLSADAVDLPPVKPEH